MSQYCTLKVIEDEIVQSFSLDVLTAAFCLFVFLFLPFGLIKNVDTKGFFCGKKKKLVLALKFSKIVEFKNLVWWFSVVFQCI